MAKRGPSSSVDLKTPTGSGSSEFKTIISIKKWFTDIATVKEMFQVTTESSIIQNEEQILSGTKENYLNHKNIIVNSEKVKQVKKVIPPDNITFSNSDWMNLTYNDLVKGTVEVYDTDDQIEMIEGTDYEIDYSSGKIRRLMYTKSPGNAEGTGAGEGSAIAEFAALITVQKKVKVFYKYFKFFLKEIDYSINYERGSIARLGSGSIESGSKVYVDYIKEESIRDSFITLMIDSAHTYLMNLIPETFEGSTELDLKYGESFYTLFLINKFYAQKLIIDAKSDDVDLAAKQLLEVAQQHYQASINYLKKYISSPNYRKRGLKLKKNISWDI